MYNAFDLLRLWQGPSENYGRKAKLDVEETDELLAAIDEGIHSAETERTFSLEEVRAEIKKWATKSA